MTVTTKAQLHPDLLAIGREMAEAGLGRGRLATDAIAQMREKSDAVGVFVTQGDSPVAHEGAISFDGPHGPLPCRLYRDGAATDAPLLVYFHGGGFLQGALPGWDAALRRIVRASGADVLSVDYRLAPEHRFPVAFEESAALMTALRKGEVDGLSPRALATGGDSAGANLALGTAIASAGSGTVPLKHMMLFYGVYTRDTAALSWRRLGDGSYGLSVEQMQLIWRTYLSEDQAEPDWRIEPATGTLKGLPPARLVVGDLDPLLDDSHNLHDALTDAGVWSDLVVEPFINHGVVRFAAKAPVVARIVDEAARAMAEDFGK